MFLWCYCYFLCSTLICDLSLIKSLRPFKLELCDNFEWISFNISIQKFVHSPKLCFRLSLAQAFQIQFFPKTSSWYYWSKVNVFFFGDKFRPMVVINWFLVYSMHFSRRRSRNIDCKQSKCRMSMRNLIPSIRCVINHDFKSNSHKTRSI